LAGEKLQIYSAHDSTIIALMQSLGLITSPESEYLLPPYAASVTFELRHRKDGGLPESGQSSASGLYVNALYGFAVPVPPSASSSSTNGGSDATSPSSRKWIYHRHPIALRCPDATATSNDASSAANMADEWMARKQWQCPLESFKKYVLLTARSSATAAAASSRAAQGGGVSAQTRAGALVSSQTYSPDDGCCVRTPAFHALGCDSIAATATTTSMHAGSDHASAGNAGTLVSVELESECVAFRQRCPATACPTGYVLDPANLACVAVSLPTAAATTPQRSNVQPALDTVDVNNDGVSLTSLPVNSGGDVAVLPLPPVHPRGSSSRFSSTLSHPLWLFLFCCSFLLVGFALGSWWTRRVGSRSLSGSRGKHAYAYEAGGGSGDEHEHEEGDHHHDAQHAAHDSPLVAQDSQSLLTRFAGKRKTSPTVNANGAGMA
jgi:hypothetical protein